MDNGLAVDVRNLVRHFGLTKAVDDISFSFGPGDIVGFIGPNGAGKTTTLRIMATLDEPTSGDALIGGVSVKEDPEAVRKVVGFVPDNLPMHGDMTVEEYLDFFARAYGIRGPRLRKAVDGVMDFAGLHPIKEKLLKHISKGMKQRVSLGRALIHDPAVLLMDEPTAGLDPRARVEFRELVLELARLGKSILVSSHILTELKEICTGVLIIEHGKILESGTLDAVRSRAVPRQVVAVMVRGDGDALYRDALVMPGVIAVRQSGEELHIEMNGDEETRCTLLAALVQRGHRIAEFRRLEADLEDIFMHITNGDLQ